MNGRNFVGDWVTAKSGRTFDRENPADITEIVATFPESNGEDVDVAAQVAVRASSTWRMTTPHERKVVLECTATLLRERSDAIGDALVAEEGKTVAEGRGEVLRAADVFAYFASLASAEQGRLFGSSTSRARLETRRRPLGVVAAITPFNFPAFVSSFKIAGALMAGNSVIWKPSPMTPMTGALIVQALLDAKLPPGAIGYLTGTSAELGEALVAHPDIDAVSFTGSTHVGRLVEVAAARHEKRCQVEKGGNNPLIVTADADLEAAAKAVIEGAFGGTGQKCTATSRLIVDRRISDELIDAICDRARDLAIGRGDDPTVFMGPLVSNGAQRSYREAIDKAAREGATIVSGGYAKGDLSHGYFVEPTIVRDVDSKSPLVCDEVFGPMVVVLPYHEIDEAIRLANATPFGLSAGIYSRAIAAVEMFNNRVEAGMLNVNLPTTGVEPHVPFGGLKASGSGPKELGQDALTFYSKEITIASRT